MTLCELPQSVSDVARPAAPPIADQHGTVLSNDWVNARYKLMTLAVGAPAVAAKPGQFFHILCAEPDYGKAGAASGPFIRRPMSVFNADPASGRVQFLYNVVGKGTRWMAEVPAGGRVSIVGPLGHGFDIDSAWRHIVIVARGVGLATLAPLATRVAAAGGRVTAVLSARNPDDLMEKEFTGGLPLDVRPVFDSDGSSDVAKVEALLRGVIAEDRPDAVFTCGSNRLFVLLQRLAREHGIPGQVALEQQMGCGLGMCFCCVRPIATEIGTEHQRVCVEGPVFDLAQALSW